MAVDRTTAHLYPSFASKLDSVLKELRVWCQKHWPEGSPAVAETFRSVARQQELYAKGRTKPGEIVTNCDGVHTPSNHQSCLAADVVGEVNGELTWDCPDSFWEYLGHVARANGLTWGGDWHMKDLPHVEWPESDHETYKTAQLWKQSKGLV